MLSEYIQKSAFWCIPLYLIPVYLSMSQIYSKIFLWSFRKQRSGGTIPEPWISWSFQLGDNNGNIITPLFLRKGPVRNTGVRIWTDSSCLSLLFRVLNTFLFSVWHVFEHELSLCPLILRFGGTWICCFSEKHIIKNLPFKR